ncbi:MAG: hypothetical protein M3P31_00850 [Actinomycetota bacterium]|nr:hypothetical protein [Actinomycetota bacterium]
MTGTDAPADLLRRESRSLVQRLRLWTPARYAAAAAPWGTRADLVLHLAQACADAVADLEREPRRTVPRLDSDLGLADQLAVTSDDLVRAQPDDDLARDVTAHLLVHRLDLLGEDVPASLAGSLGVADVVRAGRAACARRPDHRPSRQD